MVGTLQLTHHISVQFLRISMASGYWRTLFAGVKCNPFCRFSPSSFEREKKTSLATAVIHTYVSHSIVPIAQLRTDLEIITHTQYFTKTAIVVLMYGAMPMSWLGTSVMWSRSPHHNWHALIGFYLDLCRDWGRSSALIKLVCSLTTHSTQGCTLRRASPPLLGCPINFWTTLFVVLFINKPKLHPLTFLLFWDTYSGGMYFPLTVVFQ